MAEVVLTNVNKHYGGIHHAVKDFNLTIADHEFVVLVGPSGCGKSTTLRMIAGLEEITSGTIRIGDRVVNDLPPRDRDIAMVFQNYALYQHMTVYDNLAFGLRNRKESEAKIKEEIDRAVAILGIEELLKRKPKQLSGGQQQRVALGRCIVRNPQVFLFDEPLSNLDAKLRAQMRIELKKLRVRVPTTSVFVTHDQVEAMTLGDRVVIMKDGVVEQVGTPLEVYNNPETKFVGGFIGAPPMNFIDLTIKKESDGLHAVSDGINFRIPDQHSALLEPYQNKDVNLGIRPEHIALGDGAGANACAFDAGVEVIEQLGAQMLLDIAAGKQSMIVAGIDPNFGAKVGESLHFSMPADRMHFFDPGTEHAIL